MLTNFSHNKDIIETHKESFDGSYMRDYTDYYIDEQIRQGEKSTFTGT